MTRATRVVRAAHSDVALKPQQESQTSILREVPKPERDLPTLYRGVLALMQGAQLAGDVLMAHDLMRFGVSSACATAASHADIPQKERALCEEVIGVCSAVSPTCAAGVPSSQPPSQATLSHLAHLAYAAVRDGAIVHWRYLEEALALARGALLGSSSAQPIATPTSRAERRALLGCAFDLLKFPLNPLPRVCERVSEPAPYVVDKPRWVPPEQNEAVASRTTAAAERSITMVRYQDGGVPVDVDWIHLARLPLARTLLPLHQQEPYVVKAANMRFWRGDAPKAIATARNYLDEYPNSDTHNALLRYMLASETSDEAAFLEVSESWWKRYGEPAKKEGGHVEYANERSPDRPLRVGFLCDFLHSQIAQHTLLPQFRVHDRSQVSLWAYNAGTPAPEVESAADHAVDVRGYDVDALYKRIQDDRIDVLVDLNGRLREDYPYALFCRKPAPIQLSWYNLVETIGMPTFDGVISDDVSLPKSRQPFYIEPIRHLPSIGTWTLPDTPQVSALPSLTRESFVVGCFGAAFKLNQPTLDLWCKMLHEVPVAVLYLKNLNFNAYDFKTKLLNFFVERGIPAYRLRFEHGSSLTQMRELYAQMDLALDTFPYNNGSTNIIALWQGVPMVTLAGEEFRSRISTSMLSKAGLADKFVAKDRDAYIERICYFSENRQELASIRETLRERLLTTGYFRPDIYAPAMEKLFRQLWHDWLKH